MTKPGFEPLLIGHSQKNDSYMLKSASLLPVQLVFQTKSNQLIYKRLSDGLNFSSKHIRQHTSTPPQKYDLNKIKGKQKRKTHRLPSADRTKKFTAGCLHHGCSRKLLPQCTQCTNLKYRITRMARTRAAMMRTMIHLFLSILLTMPPIVLLLLSTLTSTSSNCSAK